MKTVTVTVKITFAADGTAEVDLQTNGVPHTLIVEAITNLKTGLCESIVSNAEQDVPEEALEDYIDAQIAVDREKVKLMLK